MRQVNEGSVRVCGSRFLPPCVLIAVLPNSVRPRRRVRENHTKKLLQAEAVRRTIQRPGHAFETPEGQQDQVGRHPGDSGPACFRTPSAQRYRGRIVVSHVRTALYATSPLDMVLTIYAVVWRCCKFAASCTHKVATHGLTEPRPTSQTHVDTHVAVIVCCSGLILLEYVPLADNVTRIRLNALPIEAGADRTSQVPGLQNPAVPRPSSYPERSNGQRCPTIRLQRGGSREGRLAADWRSSQELPHTVQVSLYTISRRRPLTSSCVTCSHSAVLAGQFAQLPNTFPLTIEEDLDFSEPELPPEMWLEISTEDSDPED